MKRISLACHGVWQSICLLFGFEPILGSFDGYWYCLLFLCIIGIAIILYICIVPTMKIQRLLANSGYVSLIYLTTYIFGMLISYFYQSNLLYLWLFMIVNEFIIWMVV